MQPDGIPGGTSGQKASDGKERILDIIPETLHQRRSFFVGMNHMVEDVERFIREFPESRNLLRLSTRRGVFIAAQC